MKLKTKWREKLQVKIAKLFIFRRFLFRSEQLFQFAFFISSQKRLLFIYLW